MGFRRKVIPRLCQNLAQLPKASQKFQIFRGGGAAVCHVGTGTGRFAKAQSRDKKAGGHAGVRQFGFRLATGPKAGAGRFRAARLPQTPRQASRLQPPNRTAAGASLRRALAAAVGAGGAFLKMLRALARAVRAGGDGRGKRKRPRAVACGLVSEMRFELTQHFCHYPLKVACLPIPPPGHGEIVFEA